MEESGAEVLPTTRDWIRNSWDKKKMFNLLIQYNPAQAAAESDAQDEATENRERIESPFALGETLGYSAASVK